MSYWTATDDILRENGGHNPTCSACGQEMFPIDDHGRFSCGCPGRGLFADAQPIPQVPEGVVLTDAQKAEIPPMYRLHHTPTAAEQKVLDGLLAGMRDLLPKRKGSPGSKGKQ